MTRHALSRATKRLMGAAKIADATLHDVRRTGSTFITGERIGAPRFRLPVAQPDIGHRWCGSRDRGLRPERASRKKRRAIEAWAALLKGDSLRQRSLVECHPARELNL